MSNEREILEDLRDWCARPTIHAQSGECIHFPDDLVASGAIHRRLLRVLVADRLDHLQREEAQ